MAAPGNPEASRIGFLVGCCAAFRVFVAACHGAAQRVAAGAVATRFSTALGRAQIAAAIRRQSGAAGAAHADGLDAVREYFRRIRTGANRNL